MGAPDVLAWLVRQAADAAWGYGTQVDLRLVTWIPAPEDMRRILGQMATLSAAHGRRGPVAVVATLPALSGMAPMSASLGLRAGEVVQVFYEPAQAEHWLDQRQAPPPTPVGPEKGPS